MLCFPRDSSRSDGHKGLCDECGSSPRMTTTEHTQRLKENNYRSEAVKKQRWSNQDDYRDSVARQGRMMHHSALLLVLDKLIPSLYVTEGNIVDELAVFRIYGQPQPDLEGRSFKYLFYMPTGILPEFSTYEFDEVRNVLIREDKRGWRTVLLKLIRAGLLDENTVNKVFGVATGEAATVYNRSLFEYRNQKVAA